MALVASFGTSCASRVTIEVDKLPNHFYRVDAYGNGYATPEQVEVRAALAAARETEKAGHDCFVVLHHEANEGKTFLLAIPFTKNGWKDGEPGSGRGEHLRVLDNDLPISGRDNPVAWTQVVTLAGYVTPIKFPGVSLLINTMDGPPSEEVHYYVAKDVVAKLRRIAPWALRKG